MIETGFAEINDKRLKYTKNKPWYLEIALTGKCNFNCTYCNRFDNCINEKQVMTFIKQYQFKHIQLTGGEPTLYPNFDLLINNMRSHTKTLGISTNGSADNSFYESLPIDMFSISLDDYDKDILKQRGYRHIDTIINNIKKLSKSHYVNIGLVIDSINVNRIEAIIKYILDLGVDDIKLSVSTKDNVMPIFKNNYNQYPILKFRTERFNRNLPMRGYPSKRCHLAANDVSIVGDKHYPCLVYFREKGLPIGNINDNIMQDRLAWSKKHNTLADPICSKFCMDFKCEFNMEKERLT